MPTRVFFFFTGVCLHSTLRVRKTNAWRNSSYTYIVQGLVIIVAVAIDIRKYLAKK